MALPFLISGLWMSFKSLESRIPVKYKMNNRDDADFVRLLERNIKEAI